MTAADWAFAAYILIGLVLFLGAIIFVLEGNVTRLAVELKREQQMTTNLFALYADEQTLRVAAEQSAQMWRDNTRPIGKRMGGQR